MYAKHDVQLTMDDEFPRTKPSRPVRNKRQASRKSVAGHKQVKRLFTPEIKRFLKEWLVRRRENPYPNRDEKKRLAVETGLTYIQICNWFANWRRKLKNASSERNKKTWAYLIKTYNNTARGNVEQFSICSEDSIWEETDPASPDSINDINKPDHCYSSTCPEISLENYNKPQNIQIKPQCYRVSSTTENRNFYSDSSVQSINKYKSHIMEKYLKGLGTKELSASKMSDTVDQPIILTKWLESAAKFQPRQSNYVAWVTSSDGKFDTSKFRNNTIGQGKINDFGSEDCFESSKTKNSYEKAFDYRNENSNVIYIHGQEEVEAAVALTRLAGLFRS